MGKNRYRVELGSKVSLKDWSPSDTNGVKKDEAREETAALEAELNGLQEQLYANERHALLIVLQGMDTSGKDGVIKKVTDAFNPQGCQVIGFKVPSKEELAHDFLWRIHKVVPGRGMVGIFNRSHYEDVLVARVEKLVDEATWRKRYGLINDFEELLAENGVVIRKFFLHISQDEQRRRLEERIKSEQDQWKFRVGDLAVRAKWDEYMEAYDDALTKCNTDYAPWHIVPADRKWYRDLEVSRILADTLRDLKMEWPPLEAEAVGIKIV